MATKGNAKTSAIVRRYEHSVLGNYGRSLVAFVRGKGSWLWDADGRRYLDMVPGLGAGALGHSHPAIVRAVRAQVARLIHVQNTYYHPWQGQLARELTSLAGFPGAVFFCNSGAEANEAAIKLARRRGQSIGGKRRYEIVSMRDSFHGRTFGALSATGGAEYRKGCGPMLPGFRYIPANDIAAAKRAIGRRTCAVMAEPILGEGGIQELSPAFLIALRALSRRAGALLILDEVQCGCGRTGSFFACRQDVRPDLMTLAKPLAGGLPVGAMIVASRYARFLPKGTHASTFGGSPLVCAAGLAAVKLASSRRLLANVRRRGRQLRQGLEGLRARYPDLVLDVRGRGLMAGIGLSRPGVSVVADCLKRGVLLNCTHESVIRFLPALTVKPAEIRQALSALDRALASET